MNEAEDATKAEMQRLAAKIKEQENINKLPTKKKSLNKTSSNKTTGTRVQNR